MTPPARRRGRAQLQRASRWEIQQRRGPGGPRATRPTGVQQGDPQHAPAQSISTPTSIAKYNGETKPELWLADFRLAYQLGGARGDDRAIIRQLPLFLSDTARRWLEELPANQIHNWVDLVRVFEGNFKGTYIRPGNSWDLSKCKQKSGETLREYARRFSKQRTELPHIPDHDVILAFVSGTTS